MATSWSNPDPSQTSMAALSAPFHVEAAGIGPLIHSLLAYRAQQEEMRNKQFGDLMKGVSSGISGAYGEYKQGQADDAANAAIYGIQYPNDPYGGFQDSNRVPDYGGTDALRALQHARDINPGAFDPYQRDLEAARLDAEQALAHNRWTYPRGSADGTPQMTPRQQITTAADAVQAAKDYYDQYGIPESVINNQNAIHAPSDTPAVYSTHKDQSGKPVPDNAITVPQGQYLMIDPQTGEYIYRTPSDVEAARAAMQQYKAAQRRYNSMLNPQGAPAPAGPSGGSTGVRQSDVDQAAAQAMKAEQGGGGPTAADVEYLKNHYKEPGIIDRFDKHFGAGAAGSILQQ